MDPAVIAALSILFLFLLLGLGVQVGLALGLTGFLGFWAVTGSLQNALGLLSATPYKATAQFSLAVLPLFILMGVFAGHAGLAEGAFDSLRKWMGRLPGGLATAVVVANTAFGAACGSSIAACAVFTKFCLPEMRKHGYQPEFACASIASSGVLAMLIPPSVLMIMYGIITEVSIGALFIAGILPGLLLAGLYSLGIVIMVKLNPGLAGSAVARASWKDKIFSLREFWGIAALMLLVLGGIYMGMFTPTEAGAVGAFGAFALALLLRKLPLRRLWDVLQDAGTATAMIFLIFIGAQLYSRFLAVSQLPANFVSWIEAAHVSPWIVLAGFLIMYLILGCLIDSISMMLITLPIFFPISQQMGWHPLWFAILVIMAIEAGLLTPPVGLNVYMVKTVAGPDVTVEGIFRAVIPFFGLVLLSLVILAAFPQISTWLPGLMFK